MAARVTLLTDFGTRDGYVGAVKAVIATRAPGVLIDDVSHDIPPGDVRGACHALARYWRLYPEGTVHVIVVDPGVGTARRALACEADGRFLVAPDNGLFTPVLDAAALWRVVLIAEGSRPPPAPTGRSRTFHGRDVFAPAAAHLATHGVLEELGPPVVDPLRLQEPVASREGGDGSGEVVSVDRFGNLLTNLPGEWLRRGAEVEILGRRLRAVSTYGDAGPEEPVALVSSDGRVEVAVRGGSAAERLAAGLGTAVVVLGPK